MNQLVIMNNQQAVTTSLSVAENFNKRHDNVLRDIENLKKDVLTFEEMFYESETPDAYNRMRKTYYMNRDGFTLLAMGFNGKEALQFKLKYIQAFNQMEQKLKELNQPSYMINDPVERAEKWIEEQKEKAQLQIQIEQDQPFTNFGKVVSMSDAVINFGTFAKMLYDKHGINIGRNKLIAWAREKGFLIKQIGAEFNLPKQKYIERGWFKVRPTVVKRTHGDVEKGTTLITGKGQVELANILIDEFNNSKIKEG